MLEAHLFPLAVPTGIASALSLLFAFVIGHAFADFPLQGDFLSRGKNRHGTPILLAEGHPAPAGTWAYLMSAHCLIHAGFVWLACGSAIIALAEFILHWLIDVAKCERWTSFAGDQWLHVGTKALYVIVLWYGWV